MKQLENSARGHTSVDRKLLRGGRLRLPLVAPLKARLADWRRRWGR